MALAMCVLQGYGQTWSASENGVDVSSEARLVDNKDIKVEAVYTVKGTSTSVTLNGHDFKYYIPVRVAKAPSSSSLTGTLQSNCTPLVVTAKKSGTLVLYYRRQANGTSYAANDGKDLIMVDQAAISTYISGEMKCVKYVDQTKGDVVTEKAFCFVYKTLQLEKDHVYTLYARGTTVQFLGFDYTAEAQNPTVTLSGAGMGTFCAPSTYKAPEDLEVYTAAEADNVVTLTKVADGVIPAEQGVVLSGKADATYTMEPTTTDKTGLEGNALKAAVSATTINNENTYVLICNNDNKGQFALLEKGETIPAGKAYLELGSNEAGANYLSLAFGNETAIKAIDAAKKTVGDNAYYNLQGKKIERPQHGAYIHNGKVYVIK